MSLRSAFRPLTHVLRSIIGTDGAGEALGNIASTLDIIKSRLDALEQIRAQDNPAAPAMLSRVEMSKFVHVSPPDVGTYELSVDAVEPDAYHQAVAEGSADASWHFLNKWIRPGDVVFDLGANIGTISIPAAVKGARVHSFELLDANVRHLVRAVERNGLKNITITLGAVSDREGLLGIGGYSAWGTIVSDALVSVPAVIVDAYVHQRKIARVDLIKLDIEGSELHALHGASKLIQRDRPDIVMECNVLACGNNGYSHRELLRLLKEHGYAIYRFYDTQLCPHKIEQVQEVVVADYLATAKTPEEVVARSGWKIASLTDEEIIASIETQTHESDVHKQYVLSIRERLPAFVVNDARVAALLERWVALADPAAAFVLAKGAA